MVVLRHIIIAVFVVLCGGFEAVALGNHFVTNFSQGILKKGAQTWQISMYDDSWVYFANKEAMLQYDGNSWKSFPMNNRLDVRSVFASKEKGRIYVGGINEIGYYAPDDRGLMKYTCIKASKSLSNVWGIREVDDVLYAQGDSKLLVLNGKKSTLIDTGRKMIFSNAINGVLYVGAEDGLYMLVGQKILPANGTETLKGRRVCGIYPYKGKMIVATATDGLFYYDGINLRPIVTGYETYMAENSVFCIAIKDDVVAIGTVQKGLLVYNLVTGRAELYNESNGLQNNTVLSLSFDSKGNLWAGLDSGIDYIWLTLPVSKLYIPPYSIGAGYAAALSGSSLYLGTNRGLFYIDYTEFLFSGIVNVQYVAKSDGQVWGIQRIGDDLFCMHDRGLFLVKGKEMERIGDCTGIWSLQEIADGSGRVYVGTYSGLYVMRKIDGRWSIVAAIDGMNDSSYNFEQQSPSDLWIMDTANGMINVKVDLNGYKMISAKIYGEKEGFPSSHNIHVSKINGRISFSTSDGMYRYDKQTDRMVPDNDMNRLLVGDAPYSRLFPSGKSFVTLSGNVCVKADLEKKHTTVLPLLSSGIDIMQGWENMCPLNDSVVVLPNYYGFAFLNFSKSQNEYDRVNLANINTMLISYPRDSVIYSDNFMHRKYEPEIPYSLNSVKFEFGVTGSSSTGFLRYQCRLKGMEDWSGNNTALSKEYTNLDEGHYTFEVRVVGKDGVVQTDELSFVILPPWYRSIWAYVVYFILMAALVWYLATLERRRVEKKKAIVVKEKDRLLIQRQREFEKENARKERQIMELEKEKLRNELAHKSQEMANLLMNFSRKNEILINVKEELQKMYNKMKSGQAPAETKQFILGINGKIDTNIQSDDILNKIEEQFDLVHNNFMKKLRSSHPDLSQGEVLMCAYVKMNLSSKEIAPLLNLSVRGVETMRYRIRKKFELDRDDNLNDFLQNLENQDMGR